jgi:hypothetical protein
VAVARVLLATLAGAILAPVVVVLLMLALGVVQSYCWGPGEDDACLVGTQAVLYILTFVAWIPGAFVGLVVGLSWHARRRQKGKRSA